MRQHKANVWNFGGSPTHHHSQQKIVACENSRLRERHRDAKTYYPALKQLEVKFMFSIVVGEQKSRRITAFAKKNKKNRLCGKEKTTGETVWYYLPITPMWI